MGTGSGPRERAKVHPGAPAYNIHFGGGQHNVVASGGFVLKFGK
ncbi:MAG: hypothetical protein ABI811_14675 [Acidobacteriota bacterium]